MSFCLSLPEKAAASTMALSALTMFRMLEVSTWAKEAGFLAISRSMRATARPMVSTASASSASLALKSATSFSRTAVASLSSLSLVAMLAASSSTFETPASMSPVSLPIAASSLAFAACWVLISKPLFVAASSHHSTYSLYAFSSASPSAVIFDSSDVMSSRTLPRGLASTVPAAAGAARRAQRPRRSCMLFICDGAAGASWE
mmetsp:Transcript_55769/g.76775  ORF Transcript_55769/g.76775 Transcript_55769/m.76775 type:complete len:203 (-) Transcript_55769:22-630(-)